MSNALQKVRKKPELIQLGKRTISTSGFHMELVPDHLDEHLKKGTWCSPKCMAGMMYLRATEGNAKKIRKRVHGMFNLLLTHGRILVVEYAPRGGGGNGEITAFKIFQGESELERSLLSHQLERMLRLRQLTTEKIREINRIVMPVSDVA